MVLPSEVRHAIMSLRNRMEPGPDRLNLQETMLMRNGWISDAPFMLNGTNISECSRCEYLGQEVSMKNDLIPQPGRRRRAAWGAYKSIGDVVKKTKNTRLRAHLFNTTVLPALTFALETWASRKQQENAPIMMYGSETLAAPSTVMKRLDGKEAALMAVWLLLV
ncbi:hypothetical protein RB195_019128 [Necator americanus]|uniref:SCP domain-containing protein n=1 Tax=Necator americanus TaxID=51031 RepID=A0ABR1CEI8_NECAM